MKKGLIISVIFIGLMILSVSNVSAASDYYFATVDKAGTSDRSRVKLIEKNGAWAKWCTFPAATDKSGLATALSALSLEKDVYVYVNASATNPVLWEIYLCD
jgi:hypothetical protein